MLKKISVFALLLSLLVGMFGAVPVKADEETKVIPAGKYSFKETLGHMDLISHYDNWYLNHINFYMRDDGDFSGYCYKITPNDSNSYYISINQTYQTGHSSVSGFSVEYYDWGWNGISGLNYKFGYNITRHFILEQDAVVESAFYDWFKLNVEDHDGLLVDLYTLEEWCADAGLNCAASSNESDSVVPFFYEPDNYNYIVRKILTASSTSGVYQVTMLQKTDGAHYPYYFEVNDIGYLGVAGAFSDTSAFTLRNFYYDADGNGWKLIERFDVSILPFDNTNFNFTDDIVFLYSDTDIYANREASSIWQAASTEYYNVDIPEPEAPTPTPTTVPSSGAGRPGSGTRPDTGGEATGGGGLDFIINLFTLIWQKICSIPMAVDGYSISLQQIFVYGALVSIVGGFIIKFIFRR